MRPAPQDGCFTAVSGSTCRPSSESSIDLSSSAAPDDEDVHLGGRFLDRALQRYHSRPGSPSLGSKRTPSPQGSPALTHEVLTTGATCPSGSTQTPNCAALAPMSTPLPPRSDIGAKSPASPSKIEQAFGVISVSFSFLQRPATTSNGRIGESSMLPIGPSLAIDERAPLGQ